MNKYIISLMVVFLTSFLACNEDLLDIQQQGVLSVQDMYVNADDATATSFITAVYSKLRGSMYQDRFVGTTTGALGLRYHMDYMSDDFGDAFSFNETAESSRYSKIWSYLYSTIYWCNLIIDMLPENKEASQAVKSQVIAEARAIRAIMMMYLVQLYGNPPLADHIMTGTEGNTPAKDSWAFVEKELAAAAEGLPTKSGQNGQSAIGGRITKEAAYAYLGKALLWEGKYTEAASTLYNKVIGSNLYKLVEDYSQLNRYTSDFCAEYLWECEVFNSPDYSTSQAGQMDLVYFNWGNSGINMPDDLYNLQGWANTAYSSESFGVFMEQHDKLGTGAKTKRYVGTLASYEELYDPSLFTYKSGSKGVTASGLINCEGYFRIKMIPRKENVMGGANWYDQYMHNNICYMRYSEVLLNYAEAVAKGGTPGAMSGLEALNVVRRRAGLTDAPSLDMNNATYGVKAERRAELHWEGCRFIDLVRWGDAATLLANVGKYTPTFYGYINGNNSAAQSKANWKIVKNTTLGLGFKANKNELFPIPAVDMNANPNLTQNPGW
jgi:starch-binding outer membrane protein, SusD/RagB family